MTLDLVDRLSEHRTLAGVPRQELLWLAERGRLRKAAAGEKVSAKGAKVDGLYILLQGHIVIYVDRGGGRHKGMEWWTGDVTGHLPYSRMVVSPGDSVAQEPTEFLMIHRDDLPAMIRECHEVTSRLVHAMLDRAREFTSNDLHDEKMVSLGKLAAGLAHELNNPASAVARSAKLLSERLRLAEVSSLSLGSSGLTPEQVAGIEAAREMCAATPVRKVRSPIEQAEHEDAISDWLQTHGADPSLAEPLAETAVTAEALDLIARSVSTASLDAALRSVAAGCSVRALALEIEESAARISELIAAVKGFTHMDQATVAEPFDVGQGLTQTLVVLGSKARSRSLSVLVRVEPDLPRVRGYGGELNQVWSNLIDNALDAASASGRVEVTASREDGAVVVRVVDDGPGIAPDLLDRIFEPFFTTKPVGSGTGLGLDIARRLVRHNDGTIEVESAPGRTEFRVTLPIAHTGSHGEGA